MTPDHCLTIRAHTLSKVTEQPVAWRVNAEAQCLERALQLRRMANENYRSGAEGPLPIRTLQSLVDELRGGTPRADPRQQRDAATICPQLRPGCAGGHQRPRSRP